MSSPRPTEAEFPIMLRLMLEAVILRVYGPRRIKPFDTAEFEAAAKAVFPAIYLDFCRSQLTEAIPTKGKKVDGQWLFVVPPKELLGGKPLEECFSIFLKKINRIVSDREAKEAFEKRDLQNRRKKIKAEADFMNRIDRMTFSDLCTFAKRLSEGWKKSTVSMRIIEIEKQRASFYRDLVTMEMPELMQFASRGPTAWHRNEAQKALQRFKQKQQDFAKELSNMSTSQVRKFNSVSLPAWKKLAIEKRRKQYFQKTLENLTSIQLTNMASSPQPDWKLSLITSQLDNVLKADFEKSSLNMSIEEAEELSSKSLPQWKQLVIRQRLDGLYQAERHAFRKTLQKMNLEDLRKLAATDLPQRKKDLVNSKIDILHKAEVEFFARSLRQLNFSELDSRLQETSSRWERDEIIKRQQELRIHKQAEEDSQFISTLNGKEFDELKELAVSFPDGPRNHAICHLIVQRLPALESRIVERLSLTEETGLQRVSAMARAELRFRKEEADPVQPRIIKGWV